MNNQEILANAPEGATHVQYEKYYWKVIDDCHFEWDSQFSKWVNLFGEFEDFQHFRSLEDIRRIAELESDKKEIIRHYEMWKSQWYELNESLEIRDLEQQAEGVESLRFPTMLRKMWAGGEMQEWLSDCAEGLREQAKALKEQG